MYEETKDAQFRLASSLAQAAQTEDEVASGLLPGLERHFEMAAGYPLNTQYLSNASRVLEQITDFENDLKRSISPLPKQSLKITTSALSNLSLRPERTASPNIDYSTQTFVQKAGVKVPDGRLKVSPPDPMIDDFSTCVQLRSLQDKEYANKSPLRQPSPKLRVQSPYSRSRSQSPQQ